MGFAAANMARLVLSSILTEENKAAVQDEDTSLSRRELIGWVAAQAESLCDQGLKADDFVVLLCNRGVRFWVELLAAWSVGAKPICVESNIADDHAASVMGMTDVKMILFDGVPCPAGFASLTALSSVKIPDDIASAPDSFASLPFPASAEQPDLGAIIFTSGTTGLPKGVPLTHQALIDNALATGQRLRLLASDRLMIATPFRFISSLSHFFVTLLSGATFMGVERTMMIKDLLGVFDRHHITAFGGSPFHVRFIAMAGQARCPSLRWIMSSGDHLPVSVIDQLMDTMPGVELHVVYGMAELAGRFCELPPERQADKRGSVGMPIAGLEFSIRNEEGTTCVVGEIGNIYVSGILGFEGYFKNPEANAKVLGEYGFMNGDKGYLDEDGFLFLAGRSDSVFKRSGQKVSAQRVTDALIAFDYVKDAHTTSEEDLIEGQVPVSFVVWNGEPRPVPEVLSDLRKVLSVNHLPRKLVTLESIPRTGSGKVDRRKLADVIADLKRVQ